MPPRRPARDISTKARSSVPPVRGVRAFCATARYLLLISMPPPQTRLRWPRLRSPGSRPALVRASAPVQERVAIPDSGAPAPPWREVEDGRLRRSLGTEEEIS